MRTDMKPFPLIDLKGTWHDMGVEYGRDCKPEIEHMINWWKVLLEQSVEGFTYDKGLADGMARYAEPTKTALPDIYEFIEGIGEGSGFGIEAIMLINAASELMGGSSEIGVAPTQGCTSLAIDGNHTPDGKTIIAQNVDWHPDMRNVVLRIQPDNGPKMMGITSAGMTIQIGIAEGGFGLMVNSLLRVDAQNGVPMYYLCQGALSQKSIRFAMELIANTPRAMSFNYLFADKDGSILDLETTIDKVAGVDKVGGKLVHTNHYQTLWLQDGDLMTAFPDTYLRRTQAREMLDAKEKLGVEDVKAILRHHQTERSSSICCHEIGGEPFWQAYATIISVIAKPEDGIFYACVQPCEDEYVEYSMND